MNRRFFVVICMLVGCGAADGGGSTPDDSSSDATSDAAHDDITIDTSVDARTTDAADAIDSIDARDASRGIDAGSAACASGGEIATSKGLEAPWGTAAVGVCRRALGCPSKWTLAAPDLKDENNGTPNQRLLWRDWYYGWAQLAGTAADRTHARDDLVQFFDLQKTYGHQAIKDDGYDVNEVLTTSHYEIWSNGAACARLLAVIYGKPEVLAATGDWWRGEIALYDLLARDGSIDAPGTRFPVGMPGGPLQLRDVMLAMVHDRPLPKPANDPTGAWWSDFYNVGAWEMREVLRLGDDLGGARAGTTVADLPALRDPLHVDVKGADYVFSFPSMRGALQPLFWVASIGGTKSYAPVVAGTPSTSSTPAPTIAGATETIVPGTP